MERLIADDRSAAVESGRQKLASNEMDANGAVLIYDGQVQIDDQKLDAIIIEMRAYCSLDSRAVIAVPYRPKTNGSFRVHKPKVLVWEGCEDFDLGETLESFIQGISEHEKGAAIWNACLDESI